MALPILTTARLTLRPLEIADVPAIHAWLSNPEVMRFWSTLPHQEITETEDWVRLSIAETAKGSAHDFGVVHEDRLIGRVALWQGDEIGFFFDPAMRGKGFATEALRALCAYGFEMLGFDQIKADVDPDNAPSLRVLERVGFIRTGLAKNTFEIGGKFFDSVYLSLKRP
jgi:[ribosomal protein S5]-alanine N-acetyltransferase